MSFNVQVGYLVRKEGKNVRTIFNEDAKLYFDDHGCVIGAGDKRAKSTFMPPKYTVDPFYITIAKFESPVSHPEK